jgi:hypothetical protein
MLAKRSVMVASPFLRGSRFLVIPSGAFPSPQPSSLTGEGWGEGDISAKKLDLHVATLLRMTILVGRFTPRNKSRQILQRFDFLVPNYSF